MTFIIFFIFTISLSSSELYIVSDYDYTNQNFTFYETSNFVKHWKGNRFTSNQIYLVYKASKVYKLHVLIPLTRASVEQDILENNFAKKDYKRAIFFAMGYGHNIKYKNKKNGTHYYKYGGFELQIIKGCELKRKKFDLYNPKATRILLDQNRTIHPKNASTYSLYWYTPYYGKHKYYKGVLMWGNELFELRYKKYKKVWLKLIQDQLRKENEKITNITPVSIQ